MDQRLPPLQWLRVFEAAARASSFSRAAEELGISQTAVSYQVKNLETHLGFPLFERLPRSVQLTEMGRAYLDPVRKAIEDLAAATIGLFGPPRRRALLIRAPVSFATLWLVPRLPDFAARHPDLSIRLYSAIWAESLPADRVDVDIRYGDGRWPGFHAEKILQQPAIPVCAPDYLARAGRIAKPRDLLKLNLLHIMGVDDGWDRLLGDSGTMPKESYAMDTSLAALELACTGAGVALVLSSFAEPYLRQGRLVRPIRIEQPQRQAHYIAWPSEDRAPSFEVAQFLAWIKAAAGVEAAL